MGIVVEKQPAAITVDGKFNYEIMSDETLAALQKYVLKGIVPSTNTSNALVAVNNRTITHNLPMDSLFALIDRITFIENNSMFMQTNPFFASISLEDEKNMAYGSSAENNEWFDRDDVIKIDLPVVDGQPKESILFTREVWAKICAFICSVFFYLIHASNDVGKAEITEIFSDEETVKEDDYDGDTDDSSYVESEDPSDTDTSSTEMSPTKLNEMLYALYHNN